MASGPRSAAEESAAGGASGPVTVIVARRPRPGRESEYEAWIDAIVATSSRFEGYLATQVIRPAPGHREYITIFRFDAVAHLRAWQASSERRAHMDLLEGLVESDASIEKVEGLDLWLDSMGGGAARKGSKFRSTLLVFAVVYSMILLITPLAAWALPDLHPQLRLFVAVFVQVFLMGYLVMPPLTRLLDRWLHP